MTGNEMRTRLERLGIGQRQLSRLMTTLAGTAMPPERINRWLAMDRVPTAAAAAVALLEELPAERLDRWKERSAA